MGGALFLGIRRRDGTEHLYETWTNSIPRWFANPDFLSDGPGVDEFVATHDKLIAEGDTLYTKKHHAVTYSEYGVILVDHVKKKILSCQDYTWIGSMTTSWHKGRPGVFPPEDAAIITTLHDSRRLGDVLVFDLAVKSDAGPFRQVSKARKKKFLAMCARSTDGHLPEHVTDSFVIKVDLSDFDVQDTKDCGPAEKQRVRDFLVENGWRARVYGQKKEKP